MNGKNRPIDKNDDQSEDADADAEVLRKEYRNMQANRNAFAHESEMVLRRQQLTIEKLRSKNESLKENVAILETANMAPRMTPFEQSQLDKACQELDRYTTLVESEKTKRAAIEKEISSLRDHISKRRREMGGINAVAENRSLLQKQVKVREGKLDQILLKFNKSVARNKQLREEIDDLRGERVAYQKIYKKLEKDLKEEKKRTALLIEQTNAAYEERDKALFEIVALEQSERKEEETHTKRIEDLNEELLSINKQLLDRTKRMNIPVEVDPEEEERKAEERREIERVHELARLEEENARQRREKLERYEEMLRNIYEAMGISDVDELVEEYYKREELIFSKVQHENIQNDEIQQLEREIQALNKEKAMEAEQNNEVVLKDEMADIQSKIKSVDKQIEACQSICKEQKRELDELKEEIKLFLIRLDCKISSGDRETISITNDNISQYLGIIERKTTEILAHYQRVEQLSQPDEESIDCEERRNKRTQFSTNSSMWNPPKLLDISSSDESGDEDDDSSIRPIFLSDIDYSRASASLEKKREKQRSTMSMRRGNVIHNGRRSSVSLSGLGITRNQMN